MKKKIFKTVLFALVVLAAVLTAACGAGKGSKSVFNENGEINIAILCNMETYEVISGLNESIEVAKEDIYNKYGFNLNVELYDDGGNYNSAIALASQIAHSPDIAAAISIQEFDIVDSVASIFNEAEKPFIVFAGCYDSIAENGYDYLINDFTSAGKLGNIMGKYAIHRGLKRVAVIHTATTFETDEIKGFQTTVADSDVKIADMLTGPFTDEEFEIAYRRWQALGIDGIYMSLYDLSLGGDIVKKLRQRGSDIVVMTDYSIDNEDTISENGEYMEGVVYIPFCPLKESDGFDEFVEKCTKRFGENDYVSYGAQMYDLLMMSADCIFKSAESGKSLIDLYKAEEPYKGITGDISFNSKGQLNIEQEQCRIFVNGEFVPDETFNSESAEVN